MNIIQSIMTNNPCYKTGRKITVKGLMLHSVGCPQPSAQAFINIFNKATYKSACVHAFIDANTGDVYQTLPWNHRGWHGGSGTKGCCNDTHIGIEMCEPSQIKYTNGSNFTCSDLSKARLATQRTYESAVELFAYLCKQYGLNPLKDICSHNEGRIKGIATAHVDPEHLWNGLEMGYTMDGFRKDVQSKLSGNQTSAQSVHWGKEFLDKLVSKGYIEDVAVWSDYDKFVTKSQIIALIDKITGGMWTSDEDDISIHWVQPHVISLCGKGIISDKDQWLSNPDSSISKALFLALIDKATGGMKIDYANRKTDHWGRNHLDSLCDKGIIDTPSAWIDFNEKITRAGAMALVAKAFIGQNIK